MSPDFDLNSSIGAGPIREFAYVKACTRRTRFTLLSARRGGSDVLVNPPQIEDVAGRHLTSDLSQNCVVVKIDPLRVQVTRHFIKHEESN